MNLVIKILLGVTALLFTINGVQMMFAPVAGGEALGFTGDLSIAALNTIRGDLSGVFLGGAAFVLIGLRTGKAAWFQAVALMLVIIMIGRVVGIVMDGYAQTTLVFLAIEAVMVIVLHFAANQAEA